MERETLTFTIPDTQHTVVMHSYLTEREKRGIQTAYGVEVDKSKETSMSLDIYNKLQDLTIKAVIVSVNGKKDGEDGMDVLEFCLNLPSAQYKALYSKIKEVSDGEKKTNS